MTGHSPAGAGTIEVEAGATLRVVGDQHGTVHLHSDSQLVVTGQIHGTLHLAPGSSALIEGAQHGTVHVSRGSLVEVAPGGILAGTLHIDGLVRNGGTRGGAVRGSGELGDLPGSSVKRPVTRDGVSYYQW